MSADLLLASGSPRRRDLLGWCGLRVQVQPQDIDESRDPERAPVDHAAWLAAGKARKAVTRGARLPVVAADTDVHQGDRIFDKPTSRTEAAAHLRALSGGLHLVTTGVCVLRPGDAARPFTVSTTVRFRDLSEAEIARYLATGEADDKAGAYAIQGRGGTFVAEVAGSWTNVMGLPVEETLTALAALGVTP